MSSESLCHDLHVLCAHSSTNSFAKQVKHWQILLKKKKRVKHHEPGEHVQGSALVLSSVKWAEFQWERHPIVYKMSTMFTDINCNGFDRHWSSLVGIFQAPSAMWKCRSITTSSLRWVTFLPVFSDNRIKNTVCVWMHYATLTDTHSTLSKAVTAARKQTHGRYKKKHGPLKHTVTNCHVRHLSTTHMHLSYHLIKMHHHTLSKFRLCRLHTWALCDL